MGIFSSLANAFSSGEQPYKGGKAGKFTDYTDYLANHHGLTIDIYAMHARANVTFKAFLTSFQDSFDTSLDVNTFVGHAEPIRKMRAVDRQIQIGLDLPASNTFQAKKNLHDLSMLVRMIYPLVDKTHDTGVERSHVKAGGDPIFKVKFKNLITGQGKSPRSPIAETSGLKGYIGNINYSFDLPSGFFNDPGGAGYLYPQLINLSFTFFPFNEILPAWTQTGDEGPDGKNIRFSRSNHPYAWKGEGSELQDSWASTTENLVNKTNASKISKALGQG